MEGPGDLLTVRERAIVRAAAFCEYALMREDRARLASDTQSAAYWRAEVEAASSEAFRAAMQREVA